MKVCAVKIRILNPPQDDLLAAFDETITEIKDESVLAVSSKVVSIWEGRCIPVADYPDKDELIKKEADLYLPRNFAPKGWVMHTIKDGLFIPTAGIDLSNAKGYYILWPKDPMQTSIKIRDYFKNKFGLKNFGVIITDSHSTPFRRGTIGITLGFAGFNPLKDYRGQKDLFGREFVVEMANIADQLSSTALLSMGEGSEQSPAAIISDIPNIEFVDKYQEPKDPDLSFKVPVDEDLYGPFIKSAPWKKGQC